MVMFVLIKTEIFNVCQHVNGSMIAASNSRQFESLLICKRCLNCFSRNEFVFQINFLYMYTYLIAIRFNFQSVDFLSSSMKGKIFKTKAIFSYKTLYFIYKHMYTCIYDESKDAVL